MSPANQLDPTSYQTVSPVLFLVFNRPDTTRQVFEGIRRARPPRLYVAADGPRAGRPAETGRCDKVRAIATAVDWECRVETLFRDENLGCKKAVSGGISWFFEHETEGIILEDDCLPNQSFFTFCDQMLAKYRGDTRVFIVSGYNKQQKWDRSQADYFFSNYGGIWGWASWRRAWDHYDSDMSLLGEAIDRGVLIDLLGSKQGRLRESTFKNVLEKKVDTWDYQWGFARHINNGLVCVPKVSLIENIGFGIDATHTTGVEGNHIMAEELSFPLTTNPFVVPDRRYDRLFSPSASLFRRVTRRFKAAWKRKSEK